MTISPLAELHDAVTIRLPQPRTPRADNDSSVNLTGPTAGQGARQREAATRWSLGQLLAGDTTPATWQSSALCAETDPEAFFPDKGGSTREAKRICTGCEVRTECLEYALARDERFGIWGGLSERERRRLRRARADAL